MSWLEKKVVDNESREEGARWWIMTAGKRGGGSKVVDNDGREEGRGEQGGG